MGEPEQGHKPNQNMWGFFLRRPNFNHMYTWAGMCVFILLVSNLLNYYALSSMLPPIASFAVSLILAWDLVLRMLTHHGLPGIDAVLVSTGALLFANGIVLSQTGHIIGLPLGLLGYFMSVPIFSYQMELIEERRKKRE